MKNPSFILLATAGAVIALGALGLSIESAQAAKVIVRPPTVLDPIYLPCYINGDNAWITNNTGATIGKGTVFHILGTLKNRTVVEKTELWSEDIAVNAVITPHFSVPASWRSCQAWFKHTLLMAP